MLLSQYILSFLFVFLNPLEKLEGKQIILCQEVGCAFECKAIFKNSKQVHANLSYSTPGCKLAITSPYSTSILGLLSRSGKVKGVAKGGEKLWTKIDELTGDFQGKVATYYDVNVTYQSSRVRFFMLTLVPSKPGKVQTKAFQSRQRKRMK